MSIDYTDAVEIIKSQTLAQVDNLSESERKELWNKFKLLLDELKTFEKELDKK